MDEARIQGKHAIAVFASGTGTNLQALVDYELEHPEWRAQIALVVSDKPHAQAVERARAANLPVFAVSPAGYPDKSAFETELLHKLKEYKVEWVVLAGYMRLIGPVLLAAYKGRIINIHPSLLPDFPGRHGIRDALTAGVPVTGVTVHFVDEGIDTGQIIGSREVPIDKGMSESELTERIHRVEHELYPLVIDQVIRAAVP